MSLLAPNLKAFLAIVQAGTVHGAAHELRLTQTAITQRIRSLEKELGCTLFLRSRKGMRLTQEGEALLRYCKGTIELEGEVLSQIFQGGKDKPIAMTVAGPTSVITSRIATQCLPLYAAWPHLYLNFRICDAADRLSLVRSGKASFAVISPHQVPQEMDSKKLQPDRYLLVATARWKKRTLEELLAQERIIDFDENDMTTLEYLKKFQLHEKVKKPRLFVNSNDTIIKFFLEGIGFGTLTQEIARPYLDSGKLFALHDGASLDDPLALVWYPRPEMPAYFREIIKVIR